MIACYLLKITSLLLILSCVQNKSTDLSGQAVGELKKMMQLQFRALLEGDVKVLEAITSDDFKMINRKGMLTTKKDWIKMVKSGRLKYLRIGDRDDISINLYGNVSVVNGLIGSTIYELNGERLETGIRRFMAIWLYDSKTWRQVARQHTAVLSDIK